MGHKRFGSWQSTNWFQGSLLVLFTVHWKAKSWELFLFIPINKHNCSWHWLSMKTQQLYFSNEYIYHFLPIVYYMLAGSRVQSQYLNSLVSSFTIQETLLIPNWKHLAWGLYILQSWEKEKASRVTCGCVRVAYKIHVIQKAVLCSQAG